MRAGGGVAPGRPRARASASTSSGSVQASAGAGREGRALAGRVHRPRLPGASRAGLERRRQAEQRQQLELEARQQRVGRLDARLQLGQRALGQREELRLALAGAAGDVAQLEHGRRRAEALRRERDRRTPDPDRGRAQEAQLGARIRVPLELERVAQVEHGEEARGRAVSTLGQDAHASLARRERLHDQRGLAEGRALEQQGAVGEAGHLSPPRVRSRCVPGARAA